MKIIQLEQNGLNDFTSYCRLRRPDVDESFLYEKDLAELAIGPENPTVLAVDDGGAVIGAGSLVLSEHMRRGNRARVRILHAEEGRQDAYEGMFQALLPTLTGLGALYAYAPDRNRAQMEAFARLGFVVDRYSFFMVREPMPVPDVALPEGFAIEPCAEGRDEQHWCDVRNAAFATLRGSETPITAQMAARSMFGGGALPGGALMLRHHGEPVGVVRVGEDELDGQPVAEVGPLAILPGWQNKGLGRMLLRAALRRAAECGFGRVVLCVNAENERAAGLYEKEGFRRHEVAVCYRYDLAQ